MIDPGDKGDELNSGDRKCFRETLDNMLESCQIIGYDWRYIYLNHTAEILGKVTLKESKPTLLETNPTLLESRPTLLESSPILLESSPNLED